MLFYKVKIERAIKGNSNSVTGQWPTILWPLTLWTLTPVLLLWFVPLWSSLSTWTYLNPEQQPINILKLHYAMSDSGEQKWPIILCYELHNPEIMQGDISSCHFLNLMIFLIETGGEGGGEKIFLRQVVLSFFNSGLAWTQCLLAILKEKYVHFFVRSNSPPPACPEDFLQALSPDILFLWANRMNLWVFPFTNINRYDSLSIKKSCLVQF